MVRVLKWQHFYSTINAKAMKTVLPALLILLLSACANSQQQTTQNNRLVGGPCEGCEALFEYGSKPLRAVDTLPDFAEATNKIKVTGTVFKSDGKTPAAGVILYVYHTNAGGVYATKGNEEGWARRHGYIRGWVKTGTDGRYTFYTFKPGTYPTRDAPAHIHLTVQEPDGKYYWLHDYHFEGDPLLTGRELNPTAPRGGSNGLLRLQNEGNILVGRRDIVLGKNVSGY